MPRVVTVLAVISSGRGMVHPVATGPIATTRASRGSILLKDCSGGRMMLVMTLWIVMMVRRIVRFGIHTRRRR